MKKCWNLEFQFFRASRSRYFPKGKKISQKSNLKVKTFAARNKAHANTVSLVPLHGSKRNACMAEWSINEREKQDATFER